MENLTVDGLALIDVLYYTTVFFISWLLFFNRDKYWVGGLLYLWGVIFLILWSTVVISPRPVSLKIFVSLLLFSAMTLQFSLARRAKNTKTTKNS